MYTTLRDVNLYYFITTRFKCQHFTCVIFHLKNKSMTS